MFDNSFPFRIKIVPLPRVSQTHINLFKNLIDYIMDEGPYPSCEEKEVVILL